MSNVLNILLISPVPPPNGGIATWTSQYMNYLSTNSISFKLINSNTISNNNISKFKLLLYKINKSLILITSSLLYSISIKPNVVHLNTSLEDFGIFRDLIILLILKLFKGKLIVHYRCNIRDQLNNRKLKWKLFKFISKFADQNIALNQESSSLLKSTSKKSLIIPNFIDKTYSENNKIYNIKVSNILFVGHVIQRKGINEVMKAAESNPDINFTVVGPYKNSTILNHPKNMKFIGELPRHELIHYYKKADMFLFPTYSEGFPNVILEAMSFGLPIITTEVGANKDILEENGAIFVKIGDVSAITKAIENLKNIKARESMGNWNVEKVSKYYIDTVMRQLLTLYNEILDESLI